MSNLANIQKLYYCDKRLGDHSTCGNVATKHVQLMNPKDKDKPIVLPEWEHRCDEHERTRTVNRIVIDSKPFDQNYTIQKINEFLKSIIGKKISCKFHHSKELDVLFIKDNCAIMCKHPITQKYKFVYYHQIDEVLTNKYW